MNSSLMFPAAIVAAIFVIWLFNCLNILREYERAVVFRLGRVLRDARPSEARGSAWDTRLNGPSRGVEVESRAGSHTYSEVSCVPIHSHETHGGRLIAVRIGGMLAAG